MSQSEETGGDAQEAFVRWVREQHDQMARYAVRLELIGEDAEGLPIWSIPHQVFLGRFYDKTNAQAGYWYVGGSVPSDHIERHLAPDAREAVRYFALKWQLQAAQIEEGGGDNVVEERADFADVASNLARAAEMLVSCVENDDYWKNAVDPTSPA
ncbi:MAG: DUF4826 family protein [Gammaproteobacteria bacterium]